MASTTRRCLPSPYSSSRPAAPGTSTFSSVARATRKWNLRIAAMPATRLMRLAEPARCPAEGVGAPPPWIVMCQMCTPRLGGRQWRTIGYGSDRPVRVVLVIYGEIDELRSAAGAARGFEQVLDRVRCPSRLAGYV